MSNDELVKENIGERTAIEETIKEDVENVLNGFKLKSLKNIKQQLLERGIYFVEQYRDTLQNVGESGMELANAISGNKNNENKEEV